MIQRTHLVYFDEFPESASGDVTLSGKTIDWTREVQPLDSNLHTIRYTARWTESGKPVELKNELYAYKKDLAFGS